jgi:zinc transporter ZupT
LLPFLPMHPFWLPGILALSSWVGFALGAAPHYSRRHSQGDERAGAALLDHLFPATVAFFLGYLGITLLPHALLESKTPFAAFLTGAACMAFLSKKVFRRDPCCEAGHIHDPLGWTFFLALSVCSVNDGVLIGILRPHLFSGLNLGMALHKVTSSFALALALGHWHYRGSRLSWMGLANGLVSPAFFFAGLFLRAAPRGVLDVSLGFSAGILTYTVLTGMLPNSGHMLRRRPTAWIGFAAALGFSLYLGYLHRAWHH